MKMNVKNIIKICGNVVFLLIMACSHQIYQPSGQQVPPLDSEQAIFQKAESLFEQKNFDQAVKLYSDYIARYPKGEMLDAALLKLGIAYGKLDKNDNALNYFNTLIETYPDSPLVTEARIETLAIYLRQGRFRELEQESFNLLETSLQDTQRQRVNGILGDSFAASGNPNQAIQYYDSMLRLSSVSGRIDSFGRVQSVVERLNSEQTEQLLNSLKDGGIQDHLLFHLGKLRFAKKDLTGAEAVFKELLEKYPNFKEKESVANTLDSIISGEAFRPYTVGCLLPLSGSYAVYGQRALQGIEMALTRFAQKMPNFMPRLMVEDTRSDPDHAKEALEMMAREGVAAIIGPMVTAEQVAMTADDLGVPILSLTQKEYITDSGPYIFRNFITPEMQVKALVNYTVGKLGAKRFAILYPNENYGITFMDLFWDEVVVHNGMVVGVEPYNIGQTDFADAIKKLVGLYYPMTDDTRNQALAHAEFLRNPAEALQFFELEQNPSAPEDEAELFLDFSETAEDTGGMESIVDFNAVFIPDSPKMVGLIIPQLAYYDIRDVHLLGTNIWHSESLIHMSRKYLSETIVVDGFFAESEDHDIQEFVSNFYDIYKEKPEIIAATAFDSAMIIFNLLSDPTITLRSQIKDRLLTMPAYQGITGKTTFRPNGDVSKDLFILGVKGGRFVELGRLNPYPSDLELKPKEFEEIPDETLNTSKENQ